MYPGRLDDKGRIKLPTALQQYLTALGEKLGEKKLFVTSLDRHIAQIYTMDVWRRNENFFATYRDDPVKAENISFNAADLGAEAEMDSQGRITFPPELRRELGIENQPVRVKVVEEGVVEVLSEPIYEARKTRATQTATEDLTVLRIAGLR